MTRKGVIDMNKYITVLVAILLVCVISVGFTACNVTLEEMDGDASYVGTDKDRSVELVDDFFEETLKNPDFVVTCKDKNGVVQYTETVNGTSSYTLFKNGFKDYAFKKGDHFYVAKIRFSQNEANETVETHYYYCSDSTKPGYCADTQGSTMEDMYNSCFCLFMDKELGAGLIKELPEEGATFHCRHHINTINNYQTASLEFTYTTDQGTVTLTASSEGDKVTSMHLVTDAAAGDDSDSDLTWTFVYGAAAITLPDTDAWDREVA